MLAFFTPEDDGVKRTANFCEAPVARVALTGVTDVTEKSPSEEPTEEIVNVPVPVFVTVTVSFFDKPRTTLPKLRDVGVMENTGSTPTPRVESDSGVTEAECVKTT